MLIGGRIIPSFTRNWLVRANPGRLPQPFGPFDGVTLAVSALAFLAWFMFAPQCISTLVAVRRETNSWTYPMMMAAYLFALAYAASFITYRLALMGGGG